MHLICSGLKVVHAHCKKKSKCGKPKNHGVKKKMEKTPGLCPPEVIAVDTWLELKLCAHTVLSCLLTESAVSVFSCHSSL